MSSTPDIDPYAALGVSKEATIPEIRAAHRKRVLKCHPDKIQDESQRIAAQDEFQKVQQAYELLSDDARRAKYDAKARIAELKREILERKRSDPSYASPRGSASSNREYRNGHIVEERVPLDAFFEEKMRFTDEPRSMSRKFDEFGVRPKPKAAEEKDKKRDRTPLSTYHQAKELRETAKATAKASHSDRAKVRDQERRRQAEAKYDTFESYAETDEASDSSVPRDIYTKRSATPRRERDSRSRPSEASRRRHGRYEEEGASSDPLQSKFDNQFFKAEDYIASKARTSRSPRQYRGYDSTEPESSSSRSSGRSTRTRRRSSSRDRSYEHIESPRTYEAKPPKMQPSATSPGIRESLRPSFLSTRSATTSGFSRPKRESREPTLYEMTQDPIPSRTYKMRERNDSGYSSPGTPEMLPKSSSAKTSTRYKIVTEPDHIVVEPKASKHRSSRSPDRDRISSRQPLKRSTTFQNYTMEASPRIETRSARPSRHPDVEYIIRPKEKDVTYSKTYKEEDVSRRPHYICEEDLRPPRRQSAYAY